MMDKNNTINVFGLIIERKTNFVALSAFVLSLITLVWTSMWYVVGYLRGPEINFIIPDEVILFADFCQSKKKIQFIEIIAQIAYSNTGWREHNDVLLDEKIHMKLGDNNIQLVAHNIVKTYDNNNVVNDNLCEGSNQGIYPKITIENISSAEVAVLDAGSVLARDVHYVVDSRFCDSEWSECIPQNSGLTYDEFKNKDNQFKNVEIEFHAKFFKDGYKRARCKIIFNQEMIGHFTENYNLSTSCMNLPQS